MKGLRAGQDAPPTVFEVSRPCCTKSYMSESRKEDTDYTPAKAGVEAVDCPCRTFTTPIYRAGSSEKLVTDSMWPFYKLVGRSKGTYLCKSSGAANTQT